MRTLAEDLKRAFKRNGYEDPLEAILFASITVYEHNGNTTLELKGNAKGGLNMSEEEFFTQLSKHYTDEGYGMDNISESSKVWTIDNKVFIRQEYDGAGYWLLVDPYPPISIDPIGEWGE